MTASAARTAATPAPWALVLGDVDLLRAVTAIGAPCALGADAHEPARHSRFVREVLDVPWGDGERLAGAIGAFAESHGPPVVLYEWDWHVAALSAARDALAGRAHVVLPPAQLVEDLLDKQRFSALADGHGLPVPPAVALEPGTDPAAAGVPFPAVVKPLRRDAAWRRVAGPAKAFRVETPGELEGLGERLLAEGGAALVQQLVEGDETRIESYHAYVDHAGAVAGEFTGRKLRTSPPAHGFSTALVTTDAGDVRRAGRMLVERLGYRGVLKADFKRDGAGRLWLLEVNPRFSLWTHLGARAGVNLPALVYADLTGRPRPRSGPAAVGRTWCVPWQDGPAARRAGMGVARWARWAWGCDAHAVMAWSDPLPFVRGRLWPLVGRRLGRR